MRTVLYGFFDFPDIDDEDDGDDVEVNNVKICKWCGKKYFAVTKTDKYCSRSCEELHKNKKENFENRECVQCGSTFTTNKKNKSYLCGRTKCKNK